MSTSDNFLQTTPLDITIKALTSQIEELKAIQNRPDNQLSSVEDAQRISELEKENKELRTINAKAEYRIQILLNTLEKYDKEYKK